MTETMNRDDTIAYFASFGWTASPVGDGKAWELRDAAPDNAARTVCFKSGLHELWAYWRELASDIIQTHRAADYFVDAATSGKLLEPFLPPYDVWELADREGFVDRALRMSVDLSNPLPENWQAGMMRRGATFLGLRRESLTWALCVARRMRQRDHDILDIAIPLPPDVARAEVRPRL